jgi:sigma-B regulation protein RsbU (phosphoserine phosphatase)
VRFGPGREKTRIPVGEGLTGWAARNRQALRVDDVLKDPRYLRLIPETRSELVVPLVHKDRLVGVFDLESSELGRFTEEHVQVLTPLASQVAGAIENARLYDELFRREERLHRELLIARRVQAGLFPEECPSGPGFEASAHFLPAWELGGDLYDFYRIGEGRLGLAVGDVAGKGVPAALFGAFVSGTVRAQAFADREPAALLERVNRTVRRRGIDSLFCALTYASFDFAAGRVALAGSGLPYPLHYRAGPGTCEAVAVAGLPLGTFDDTTYEAASRELGQGDVLVFHTDGLTEAESAGAALPATELGDRIMEDLGAFTGGGGLLDDVTLVVVKVR